MNYEFQVDS